MDAALDVASRHRGARGSNDASAHETSAQTSNFYHPVHHVLQLQQQQRLQYLATAPSSCSSRRGSRVREVQSAILGCVFVCVCVYTYIGRRRLCNSVFNNKRCQKEAIQLSSHLALGRSPALLHTPPRCLEFEARPALSKPRKRNHNNNQ